MHKTPTKDECFALGLGGVMAAFNLADNPAQPWAFPQAVQEHAKRHLRNLIELFHESEAVDLSRRNARSDEAFQRFMQRATAKSAGRRKGGAT